MRTLFKSDFFLRFAGGFALGAAALVGVQFDAVSAKVGLGAPTAEQRLG